MKGTRLRMFLVAVTVSALMVTTAVASNDKPMVFRNLAWGDAVEKLGDTVVVEESEGTVLYQKLEEEYTLGSIALDYIGYLFFDSRLVAIGIVAGDGLAMKTALTERYGKPKLLQQTLSAFLNPNSTQWIDGDTLIDLSMSEKNGPVTVWFRSRSISEEWRAYMVEQAKKSSASW